MIPESPSSAFAHYLFLLLMMAMGIVGVILFSSDRGIQLVVVWMMAVSYIIWGVVHHLVHQDFHPRVLLEYLLITAMGVLPVSAFLLQR